MPAQINAIIATLRLWDLVDVLIVAYVLYYMYNMIKDTKAAALLKGLVVLIIGTLLSNWLDFHVINWLLQKSMTVVLVALPVVFQPELRKALERIGRGKLFRKNTLDKEELENILTGMTNAVITMSRHKIGALIVVEQETGLTEYMDTGIRIDGDISNELLINIFIPNTPLHDGAVIIKGSKIMAASCLLPLTEDRSLSKELGTRHRAGIGLTEQTDAYVIIVSEETGTISLAHEGKLQRYLTPEQIKDILRPVMCDTKLTWQDIMQELFDNLRRKK